MTAIMRFASAWAGAFFCASVCIGAGPASADDACNKPLHIAASLPMTPRGALMTVPISLNGTVKQFLITTDAPIPTVSVAVASELNLPTHVGPITVRKLANNENINRYAIVDVNIGRLLAPKMQLQTEPTDGWDGKFSVLAFKAYDFDFDFANAKLNMVSKDHCEGKVVYWPHQALAVVPVKIGFNITIPVLLDGKKFKAVISTSVQSSLRLDEAKRVFDLTPDSPDMVLVGHSNNNPKFPAYQHHFQTLSFDGVTVANPQLLLPTDPMDWDEPNQTGNASRYAVNTIPQVMIGMDILSKLHVYFAMSEKRLYLTEAGVPAAVPHTSPSP